MKKRQALKVLIAVGAALAPLRSFAQFGGGRKSGGKSGATGGDGAPGGRSGAGREPTPMLELTLHEFQEDLKLRPDQKPLFEAYAEKIRDLAADVARERRQPPAKLGLLQRIDHNVDSMRNRLAGVEEIADAARALLAKLSPEQQGLADPRLANLMLLPLAGAAFGGASGAGGPPGRAGPPGAGGSPGGGGPDAPSGPR